MKDFIKGLFKGLTFWLCLTILLSACSSLTPLHRQEIRQAKHEAHLARIKADTLSIQRTDNTYRNTGWNLWWNDPFRYNRWGWHNQVYRPQIIIPLKKKKRNGSTRINSVRNIHRGSNSTPRRNVVRPKVKQNIPTKLPRRPGRGPKGGGKHQQ